MAHAISVSLLPKTKRPIIFGCLSAFVGSEFSNFPNTMFPDQFTWNMIRIPASGKVLLAVPNPFGVACKQALVIGRLFCFALIDVAPFIQRFAIASNEGLKEVTGKEQQVRSRIPEFKSRKEGLVV